MRILILASSFLPKMNGTVRVVADTATELGRKGDDVRLLTRWRAKLPRRQVYSGITVIRIGPGKGRSELLRFAVSLGLNAVRIIKTQEIQVMHAHGTIPGLAACLAKLATRTPFVVSFHQDALLGWSTGYNYIPTLRHRVARLIQMVISRYADLVTAQSEDVMRILADVLGIRDMRKFIIIPNAVDTARFRPEPQNSSVRSGFPIILFVGNLIRRKGIDILVRAMKLVLQQLPSARLEIIGAGPEEWKLRVLCDELRISQNVLFRGEVNEEDLGRAFEDCTVFVLPSFSEVFGVVLIEAMSLRRPVIATSTIGARSIIEDGVNGVLVSVGDIRSLAAAIVRLLSTDIRERMLIAENGFKDVESLYSVERIVPRLQEAYERLCQKSERGFRTVARYQLAPYKRRPPPSQASLQQ